MKQIADLSHYNGIIDWNQAREALEMAIFRASVGGNADKKYREYTAECGIPYGAYHYCKAGTAEEARREARFFAECAGAGEPLFWMCDIEDKAQGKDNTETVCRAFLDELRALGCRRVGLYIGGSHLKWGGNALADCDIVWIPRWGKDDGNIPGEQYRPDARADIWQYTSKGALPGIKGSVDLNLLLGDKGLEWYTAGRNGGGGKMFTNLDLARYCEEVYRAGWVYWYGTCGFNCTQALYEAKKKQYPSHYTADRESGYAADIRAGRMCADCVGLPKSFFWKNGDIGTPYKYQSNNCPDRSADGLFALCKEHGPMATMPDVPGIVVHRSGHIGVYVGSGYTIEMKGFAYDCVKAKVSAGTWTEWGRLPESMLTYVDGIGSAAETILALGDRTLGKGDVGADVQALQEALLALGYALPKYGADGDFGAETLAAVKQFQRDRGLAETGIFDTAAHKALTALQEGAPEEPDTPDYGGAPAWVLIIEGPEAWLRQAQEDYGGRLAAVDSVKVVGP